MKACTMPQHSIKEWFWLDKGHGWLLQTVLSKVIPLMPLLFLYVSILADGELKMGLECA
jgi:hypothetical protein